MGSRSSRAEGREPSPRPGGSKPRGQKERRREDHRRAWRRGRWSEALCRLVLRLKGYRILAAGFRVPVGEIDIVARRASTLAFVEVKARARFEEAAEAIGAEQRRRIARAAEAFLARNPHLASLTLRFDVMLVRPGRLPRHLEAAWQGEARGRR